MSFPGTTKGRFREPSSCASFSGAPLSRPPLPSHRSKMVHAHLELRFELPTLDSRVYTVAREWRLLTPRRLSLCGRRGWTVGRPAAVPACLPAAAWGLFSRRSDRSEAVVSQRGVLGPAESVPPGNLLDQFPEPTPGLLNQKLQGRGLGSVLTSPPGDYDACSSLRIIGPG